MRTVSPFRRKVSRFGPCLNKTSPKCHFASCPHATSSSQYQASLIMGSTSTASDPLRVLGQSVFFHITEYLPYLALARIPRVSKSWRDFSAANQSGIWRSASRRFGLDPEQAAEFRQKDRDANAAAPDEQGPEQEAGVDWR